MTRARDGLIDLSATLHYHCISRCVRRAFLCGDDPLSEKSYDHRRQWLVDRFKFLTRVFTIDICAYAVMSNHYHLVLKVNKDKANALTDEQVIERWTKIFSGTLLTNRYCNDNAALSDSELFSVAETVKRWRQRLYDISWFMKCLNEDIARRANKEDNCKGHFWESRFQSQALLDEAALLSCMAYVDLNPIRANMADDLESSDFTSIKERLKSYKAGLKQGKTKPKQPRKLLKFNPREHAHNIPFDLLDYLELVDFTGRHVHPNKTGYIKPSVEKILNTLDIDEADWLEMATKFGQRFANFVGCHTSLYNNATQHQHQWRRGVG